jgi:hypothetical protein
MAGCVVQVWFGHEAERKDFNRPPFSLVETDFADFEQFLEACADNRMICGSELWSKWGFNKGERIVTKRVPIGFRGEAIIRAQLPTWSIVELEEDDG